MTEERQFEISNRRAMVSLGPLSEKKYCTFSCAHCYVQADFVKYPSWAVSEIHRFLIERRSEYDIVYISGDTDSFARPRTEEGMELLEKVVSIGCDVLFTTRAVLDKENTDQIIELSRLCRTNGQLLIACVSISRLRSAPHIEPPPIPSPQERLRFLQALHSRGVDTVLAVRPFLPVIPPEEYAEIVELTAGHVDAVLGEAWYFDSEGRLEDRVLGTGTRVLSDIKMEKMDFNKSEVKWKVFEGNEAALVVEGACAKLGIPFFMRSGPAIAMLRARRRVSD